MEENDGYYPCPMCRADLHWEDCGSCCDGYTHHDCGEDTCCCLYPEDNVACGVCNGESGWWRCFEKKCGYWNTDELMQVYKTEHEAYSWDKDDEQHFVDNFGAFDDSRGYVDRSDATH